MAGGFLLTPLVGGLLESGDWRSVLQWFAVGVLGIVPLVWVVIRNRPEDLGQLPDGEVAPAPDAASTSGGEIWTTVEILSARNFWGLALGVGIVFGLGTGWGANAPKYVLDLGYGTQQTAYLLAAGAGVGIPATVLFGWLAERFDGRVLLWISFGAQIASFAVLRLEPGFGLLVAAFVLIGFSAGAMLPVYASLIARMFGPVSFGQVMGLAGLVLLPFGTLAPPVIGLLRDTSGGYGSTLLLLIGSFAISCAVLGLLRGHAPRVPAMTTSPASHPIAGS
jgi:cyanate permease